MDKEQFGSVFLSQNACLQYTLGERDAGHGWVGGNAPAYFDDKQEVVCDSQTRYSFYMAFVNPVNHRMLSVFLPAQEGVLFARNIYPDCAAKVFEHEVSPESRLPLYRMFTPEPAEKKTAYQKAFDYSKPTMIKAFLTRPEYSESEPSESGCFLQVGGEPFLIQGADFYRTELEKDGYSFFLSCSEAGYADGMIHGNYPLCDGALYLYAKISDNSIADVIVGFWQYY